MKRSHMKRQSDRHTPPAEVVAAYLDGNATAEEIQWILEEMKYDKQLRELLSVSLKVDAEMGLLLTRANYLPITAMAAECEEGSFCCLECEKYVLRRQGIAYDEQQLLDNALRNGWLKKEGTALHNVGKHLEQAGLTITQQYGCSIDDIVAALSRGEDVIVAVDGGELIGNKQWEEWEDVLMGPIPDHTVVVIGCDTENETITIFDPNSPNKEDAYSVAQFVNAWADAKNYLVRVKK